MDEQNTLAETDSFLVWTTADDGEFAYHIELGGVSLHLNAEEWDELVDLIREADNSQ